MSAKLRARGVKAIVANKLIDGEVVYWNAGVWKTRFGEAQLFAEDEAAGRSAQVKANYADDASSTAI